MDHNLPSPSLTLQPVLFFCLRFLCYCSFGTLSSTILFVPNHLLLLGSHIFNILQRLLHVLRRLVFWHLEDI